VEPLEAIVANSVFERRLASRLLVGFAGLALVGLYGVLNVSTVERRPEFGVRAPLGAPPGRLTAMVLRQGLAITGAGVGIGVVLSL
jgi:ABC-type antimicrobial peptide transport system permease subunit